MSHSSLLQLYGSMKNVILNNVIFNTVNLLYALKSSFGLQGQSAGSAMTEHPWSWWEF